MTGSNPGGAPQRQLLLDHHKFPGEYVFKAFGPAKDRFRAEVEQCATAVKSSDKVVVRERLSKHGNKTCVTLIVAVDTVDEVIAIYGRLQQVGDLKMVM